MKRILTIVAVLVLTLGVGSSIKAQTPSLADSLYLTIDVTPNPAGIQSIVVNMFLSLNTAPMTAFTFGLTWDRHFSDPPPVSIPASTSDWQFDSLISGGVFTFPWLASVPVDSIADNDGVVTAGGVIFGAGNIATGSDQLIGQLYLSLAPGNSWTAGSTVTLDTTFGPPAGEYLLILADGTQLLPVFLGAKLVTFTDIRVDDGSILPTSFDLSQNYPNPFNPSTKINYTLASKAHVTLEVYNVLGQTVKTLVNGDRQAGAWEVVWDGDNDFGTQVASGMYFYKLTAGDFVQTRKMVLMK